MEKRLIGITIMATVLAVVWLGYVLAQDVSPGSDDYFDADSNVDDSSSSSSDAALPSAPQKEIVPEPTGEPPAPPAETEVEKEVSPELEKEEKPPVEEVAESGVVPEKIFEFRNIYLQANISTYGGTFKNIYLHNEQYTRAEDLPEAEIQPPDDQLEAFRLKRSAGLLDIVSTWSPTFYPFQFEYHKLELGSGPAYHPNGTRIEEGKASDLKDWRGSQMIFTPCDLDSGECGEKAVLGSTTNLAFVWPDPRAQPTSPVFLEKRYSLVGDYEFELDFNIYNFSRKRLEFKLSMAVFAFQDIPDGGMMFARPMNTQAGACRVAGENTYEEFQSIADTWEDDGEAIHPEAEGVEWVGASGQYFLLAAVMGRPGGEKSFPLAMPKSECVLKPEVSGSFDDDFFGVLTARVSQTQTVVVPPRQEGTCYPSWLASGVEGGESCSTYYRLLEAGPGDDLQAAKSRRYDKEDGERRADEIDAAFEKLVDTHSSMESYQITLFVGPKDIDQLDSVGAHLSDSLDFGMLEFVAIPMLRFLRWIQGFVGSWALAIVILTVLIKMLLFPLTQKSFVQMRRMQALKPDMDKLREKCGDDKQKLNQEMFALYKRHKVNPLGGCLPMVLQMPIYIALYWMLYASVDLYQAPLGGWITDLTAPDPYYIMPLLLGVTMFIQQKLNPTTLDSQQAKMMMYVMPVMFTVFMLVLPSGLVLYIFVNTILTLVQQFFIHRKVPIST